MYGAMLALHVLICVALVVVVLLQSAKGEGLAGAFGGTSLTGTVFGGRGAATFLSKATTVLAIAFMASCIILSFMRPVASTATSTSAPTGTSAVEEAAHEGTTPPVTAPADQPGAAGTTGAATQPPVSPDAGLFDNGKQAQPQGEGTAQPAGEGQSTEGQTQSKPKSDSGGK